MTSIADIRVVQKNRSVLSKNEYGDEISTVVNISYTIQIKRDKPFAEWEDIPIIEEVEEECGLSMSSGSNIKEPIND